VAKMGFVTPPTETIPAPHTPSCKRQTPSAAW
jgi:hypothetical protein